MAQFSKMSFIIDLEFWGIYFIIIIFYCIN